MKTKDGLHLNVKHNPEAENDWVVLSVNDPHPDCDNQRVHLTPQEAIDVATALLRTAKTAQAANERYLAGKG